MTTLYIVSVEKKENGNVIFASFKLEEQSDEVRESIENYLSGKFGRNIRLEEIKSDYVYFEYDSIADFSLKLSLDNVFTINKPINVPYEGMSTYHLHTSFEDAKEEFFKGLFPRCPSLIKNLFREVKRN